MAEDLFGSSADKYGADYKSHLLEQYKLYVGSTESISAKRQKANVFFLSVNTLLVTVIGFLLDMKESSGDISAFISLIALMGLLFAVIWYRLIRSYKQMNTGKFELIHRIEEKLPLQLFKVEWEVLGEGKDKKKYWGFSHIEMKIPWLFGSLYALFLLNQLQVLLLLDTVAKNPVA